MIRLAETNDLPRLLEIYDTARSFMRRNGNPTQWPQDYPGQQRLLEDIAQQRLYGIEEQGRLCACFMLCAGPDETYAVITDGSWSRERPYGVLHRVAGDGTYRGVVARCVAFAAERFDYLRIDTHEDNLPMQRALAKEGFCYRGRITAHDGTPRLAYDRVK